MTPSARALTDLRKEGWSPWVVESRITTFVKRDLFNCIDILAIKDGTTLAVQVTAGSAHANRATKVRSSEYLPLMLGAGWRVEVWSYRKAANGRYVRRIENIDMLATIAREQVIDAKNQGKHEQTPPPAEGQVVQYGVPDTHDGG